MHKTDGQILIEGNTAGALGAMFAGVTVVAWYPITPSSSLPEALIGYMKKHRIDKATGRRPTRSSRRRTRSRRSAWCWAPAGPARAR
jgi:TPP-dependent indolepyruvate ferredoxin oxidoreductase alpha subunit